MTQRAIDEYDGGSVADAFKRDFRSVERSDFVDGVHGSHVVSCFLSRYAARLLSVFTVPTSIRILSIASRPAALSHSIVMTRVVRPSCSMKTSVPVDAPDANTIRAGGTISRYT